LFRFHRWRANLRILDIEELKSVPFVPRSHPFIERLIGTLRREYLDHTFFWNSSTYIASWIDRRLLQSAARSRRAQRSDAVRAIWHSYMPTGESPSLRLAIRLFRPLSHADCRVI